VLGAGLLAAGCNPALKPYDDVSGTGRCLKAAGYRVQAHFNDFVASTATRGALRATKNYNVLTVSFGKNAHEARSLRRAYRRFMPKRRARHIMEITEIEKNVLLLWTTTPTREELDAVVACLK
jgi:hypothetical protein